MSAAGSDGVKVFYILTAVPDQDTPPGTNPPGSNPPVYINAGGNLGTGQSSEENKKKFVSYENELGFKAGITNCPTCLQQVLTEVTFKAGRVAWITLMVLFCFGLITCGALCLLMPMLAHRKFKDAHHTCPRCKRVLHIEERKCCE